MASADAQKQSVIIEQYVNKLANERNELNKLQQRKSGIEKNISEITEESNELRKAYHSPHKQLADWLRNDKYSIVDRIFKQMCEDNFDGDFPSGFPEKKAGIRTFKLHIAQLIDSLEICLLLDSTYLIEEPVTDLEIKNEYYREALSLLKKRIPFSTSYESKEKLRSYIDYLTERI
ncbi:MAG: hypothetical protein QJT81_02435 [Candidatus Thiothrix putei]|uniref:Uncharacterized protein n=1 Tax=Candidatus Thiothrix putei TaxID=3080811 RepID=A0AA95HH72_9GAMM|nr:MAG: hypothetical protein QJT81_02435 [Candidatus Thiothrix putei]